MTDNLQNNATQTSSDLQLVLLDQKSKAPAFPVFHSRDYYKNGWFAVLAIIGESHRITVSHKETGLGFSEILACIPEGSTFTDPVFEGKISDFEGTELKSKLKKHSYSFKHQILNFDSRHYEPVIQGMLKTSRDTISYDFAKKAKDFELNLYAPATLVGVVSDKTTLTWTSLHTYPDEKLTILSQSRILIIVDGKDELGKTIIPNS